MVQIDYLNFENKNIDPWYGPIRAMSYFLVDFFILFLFLLL